METERIPGAVLRYDAQLSKMLLVGQAAIVSSATTAYDDFWRVVRSTTSTGDVTESEYDVQGRRVSTLGTPVAPAHVGLPIPSGLPATATVRPRSETVYDGLGRAESEITGVRQWSDGTQDYASATRVRTTFDDNGRVFLRVPQTLL